MLLECGAAGLKIRSFNSKVFILTDEVLIGREGAAGAITLNRPKSLNALTLEMCRTIQKALDEWRDDPGVDIVIITGAGEKAFCAGGDIRFLHDSGKAKDGLAQTFWREEYILNSTIRHYPKPYVALMDGITMGGGVGLSAHGSHSIMTEKTMFAMPETGIGLFPDVGGTYLLSHAPWEIGTYLALTGARCKMGDVIYSSGADIFVPTAQIGALRAELAAAEYGNDSAGDVDAILDQYAADAGEPGLRQHQEKIGTYFAHDRLEDIVAALASDTSDWAAETLKSLQAKSPISLKVTLAALRMARPQTLNWCLNMELRMSHRFIAGHDFFEGVRSVIIDKDHAFNWSPSVLEEVSDQAVAAYFEPLEPEVELNLS